MAGFHNFKVLVSGLESNLGQGQGLVGMQNLKRGTETKLSYVRSCIHFS